LTRSIVDRIAARAESEVDPDELFDRARMAGAPVEETPIDDLAAKVLRELSLGYRARPALEHLLADSLPRHGHRPSSGAARMKMWAGASDVERGRALIQLLDRGDWLPGPPGTEPGLAEKVVLIDLALRNAGVSYAFGGKLALGFYGEPRLAIDLVLNLFVSRSGTSRARWGRTRIDLHFGREPFQLAAERAVRDVEFGESKVPILAPEYLIVCLAIRDRCADWLDIEQMLVGAEDLRSGEVFGWLERILGPRNQRLDRLQELWDRTR
jgi:hypothetical protein